jgi:site-specific DNA-methyltransferase (adenine-specific)
MFTLGRQDYQWQHEPCLYGWKDGAAHYFTKVRTFGTILNYDKPLRNELHPTMKPIKLISFLIENSSHEGDTVIDFFGGSGSTLIACEMLNRTCYTAEIDPKYCDVIINRWEKLTGQKAVKMDG